MKSLFKNFLVFFLVFLLLAGILSSISFHREEPSIVGIQELVESLNQKQVQKIEVRGDTILLFLDQGKKQILKKEPGESFSTLMKNYGVDPAFLQEVHVEIKNEKDLAYWLGVLLPFLLPILLIGGFIFFMARQVNGVNNRAMLFGQSTAKEVEKDTPGERITFKDVAGAKEAKEELQEIAEFLENPKRFTSVGAKIPKGVLLMGSPGTGKTLLAKAVAGEANVPFLHMSGSEFVEMFVGVGASRVRDLFRKAKKVAPAIVFIDEIDAVGRRRGAGLGGSHDEREQTLNQILVEMDGFDPNIGVIVMAATNRPDVLDPALLRPGRFDRRVIINLPDIKDREAILKVHAVNKPLSSEVDVREIAERTPGFSGADLANLLNEAAILTVRRDKKEITKTEILESIDKVLLGPERKSHVMSERDKRTTAYHEGGHAVVAYYSPNADPVRKVSIIPRGVAGGYTLKMPADDKHYHTKAEFMDDLAVALGGYVVEGMIFGKDQISTGPSSDLKNATKLARQIVTSYGMSDKLGPRTFGEHEELIFLGREITEQRDYSEKIAEQIDIEIKSLIDQAQASAEKILTLHRMELDRLVEVLLKEETVEQEAFVHIMQGTYQPAPEISSVPLSNPSFVAVDEKNVPPTQAKR